MCVPCCPESTIPSQEKSNQRKILQLSIIVPVYRVQSTLDACVESILSQSFRDYELILVDDGSPDDCPAMCDRWAERDGRVRVRHQANAGLSAARNAGLDCATGRYVTFVDSDDVLTPGTLQALSVAVCRHPDCDIIEYPVLLFCGSPDERLLTFGEKEYTRLVEDYWLGAKAYTHAYACNKVFRRSLFDRVRFDAGKVFEDVYVLPRLLSVASKVATVPEGLYRYNYNASGITATALGPQLQMLLAAHSQVLTQWDMQGMDGLTAYFMHVVNIYMDVYELLGEPIIPLRIPRLRYEKMDIRQTLKYVVLRLVGLRRLCIINQTLHRWKPRRR